MAKQRNIFFVSPTNVADHRRGGASICSLAYLQAIAAAAPGRVVLVSPCQREELPELPDGISDVVQIPERSGLSKIGTLISGRSFDRMSPFVDRMLASTDLREACFFMNSSRGGRFSRLLAQRGVPSITLFHNVEEQFVSASVRNPALRFQMRRVADRNDRLAFAWSSVSIFLSDFDAGLMLRRSRQAVPGARLVRSGFFSPRPQVADPGPVPLPVGRDLLIACHLGVEQNIPGIVRFLERSWPLVRDGAGLDVGRLYIAGAHPAQRIVDAVRGQAGVSLVGNPSEQEMRRLLSSSVACVSTIDAGSGIKVRVSESLREGRPVIGTPHSFIGYESIDRRVLMEADAGELHGPIQRLLRRDDVAELCVLARREFDAKLSYDAGAVRMADLLSEVVSGTELAIAASR